MHEQKPKSIIIGYYQDIYSCIPVVMAPDPLGLQTVGVGCLATSEGGGVPEEYVVTIPTITSTSRPMQLAPNATAHQMAHLHSLSRAHQNIYEDENSFLCML